MTGLSGRRPVDRDLAARHGLSLLRSPPKTRSPSVKASDTRVPAPRCSSDRKKLSVVQSEVEACRSPSPCLPTQTMTASASSPEPAGSTPSSNGSPQWWQRDRLRTRCPSIGAMPKASLAARRTPGEPAGERRSPVPRGVSSTWPPAPGRSTRPRF